MNYKIDCRTPEVLRVVTKVLCDKGYSKTNTWEYNHSTYDNARYVYVYAGNDRYDRISSDNHTPNGQKYFIHCGNQQLTIAQALDLPEKQTPIQKQIGELKFTYSTDNQEVLVKVDSFNRTFYIPYDLLRNFCDEVDSCGPDDIPF